MIGGDGTVGLKDSGEVVGSGGVGGLLQLRLIFKVGWEGREVVVREWMCEIEIGS
jgi:hypothetical protein